MIPAKTRLPYEKTTKFVNALDYCQSTTFSIICRHSILDAPIKLARVNLPGIRVAKEGVTKLKATMSIGKNLVGRFDVYDTYTKSKASVAFDGGAAFRVSKHHCFLPESN